MSGVQILILIVGAILFTVSFFIPEKTVSVKEIRDREEKAVKDTAAKDTKKKDKSSKDRKPGLGTKIKNFFKNNKSELKKISWYGKKQTLKSSAVVIVCLVAVSVVLGLLDYGISNLLMWIGSLINL